MSKLAIVIPTFNRYEQLTQQLNKLTNQDAKNIIVIDNHSSDIRYRNLATEFPNVNFKVNSINIGIVGNILRAFEYANSECEYLWILSDDDYVLPNCIEKIEEALSRGPDHIYLKSEVKGDFTNVGEFTQTSEELIQNFSTISMLGLISSNIYKISPMKQFISMGHITGVTLFPHVGIFLKSITQKMDIKTIVLKDCVKWNYSQNTYPEIHHMAYLNHFEMGHSLSHSENILFQKKYLQDWGVSHFLPLAIKHNKTIEMFFRTIGYSNKLFFLFCLIKYYTKFLLSTMSFFKKRASNV